MTRTTKMITAALAVALVAAALAPASIASAGGGAYGQHLPTPELSGGGAYGQHSPAPASQVTPPSSALPEDSSSGTAWGDIGIAAGTLGLIGLGVMGLVVRRRVARTTAVPS
jgi:hypothetical protein